MLKGALISLIRKYTKSRVNSQELENIRITLLKAFMQQPDIQMLSDSDDVSLAHFDDFMYQALRHNEEIIKQFYSPTFLDAKTAASAVFNEFRSTAGRISQLGGFFELPDLIPAVIEQADEATKVALSQTSFGFHQEIKRKEYWIDAMIAAQCRSSWIRSAVAVNVIKNYRKLYLTYIRAGIQAYELLRDASNDQMRTLFLLCLSGEPAAVKHALESPEFLRFIKEARNDFFLCSIRECLILSGNVQTLVWAEQHGLPLVPPIGDYIFTRVAAASGSVSMLAYILDKYGRDLQFVDSFMTLESMFFNAAKSGNIAAINFMLGVYNESKIWLRLQLADGENYVDAILKSLVEGVMDSGHVEAFKHVLKIYMKMTSGNEKSFLMKFQRYLTYQVGSLALMEFLFGRYAYHDIDISTEKANRDILYKIPLRESCATVSKINQFIEFCDKHNLSYENDLLSSISFVEDISAISRVLAICKALPNSAWRSRLGPCLQDQVRIQNIPAVNFLLERSSELGFDPAYSQPTAPDLSGGIYNILQLAKYAADREMIIAIRKKCTELNLRLTPETPNFDGKNALQDPLSENASINDALTLPLNELIAAPVALKNLM